MKVSGAIAIPLLLLAATPGHSQDARPTPQSEATRLGALLDNGWPRILNTINRWQSQRKLQKDFREVTVSIDLRSYVLPPTDRQRLQALDQQGDKQYQAGEWADAAASYIEAIRLAEAIATRLRAVQEYWLLEARHARQMHLWAQAVRNHGLPNPHADQLAALEQRMRESVLENDFIGAQQHGVRPIKELFEQAVSEGRTAIDAELLVPDPLRSAPTRSCEGAGAPVTSNVAGDGRMHARLDLRRSASFNGIAGRVIGGMVGVTTVRVSVGADGCPLWAEVVETSGHPALDDASVKYALTGARYVPGTIGGNPVTSAFSFRVKASRVE